MKKRLLFVVVGTLFALVVIALIAVRFAGQKSTQTKTTTKLQAVVTPPPEPVKLEIFEQEVFIQTPTASEEASAVNGQEIEVGTKIRTGKAGRAQILFPNHTVTRLDKNSQVTLKEYQASPQQVTVHLDLGRIWSRISKLIGKESYQTQTDTLIATVRGTSYGMGIVGTGLSKITTFEGDVNVKSDATCANGDEVNVVANQKTTVNCKDTRKPTIVEVKEAELTADEWLQFNKKEDKALEERFGNQYFAHDTTKTDDVLGVSTGGATPTPIVTSAPQIECKGPDGKTFKTTKEECDKFNLAWSTPTPTPTNAPGATSTPTPTVTGSPTTTSTPTPITPTPTIDARTQGGTTPTPFNTPVPTATPTPMPSPTPTQVPISMDAQVADVSAPCVNGIIISENIVTVVFSGSKINSSNSSNTTIKLIDATTGISFTGGDVSPIGGAFIAYFLNIPVGKTYYLYLNTPANGLLRSNSFEVPRTINCL